MSAAFSTASEPRPIAETEVSASASPYDGFRPFLPRYRDALSRPRRPCDVGQLPGRFIVGRRAGRRTSRTFHRRLDVSPRAGQGWAGLGNFQDVSDRVWIGCELPGRFTIGCELPGRFTIGCELPGRFTGGVGNLGGELPGRFTGGVGNLGGELPGRFTGGVGNFQDVSPAGWGTSRTFHRRDVSPAGWGTSRTFHRRGGELPGRFTGGVGNFQDVSPAGWRASRTFHRREVSPGVGRLTVGAGRR